MKIVFLKWRKYWMKVVKTKDDFFMTFFARFIGVIILIDVIKKILYTKIEQYPYVKKKLLDSDKKELIKDSWRDSFWGWGPSKLRSRKIFCSFSLNRL